MVQIRPGNVTASLNTVSARPSSSELASTETTSNLPTGGWCGNPPVGNPGQPIPLPFPTPIPIKIDPKQLEDLPSLGTGFRTILKQYLKRAQKLMHGALKQQILDLSKEYGVPPQKVYRAANQVIAKTPAYQQKLKDASTALYKAINQAAQDKADGKRLATHDLILAIQNAVKVQSEVYDAAAREALGNHGYCPVIPPASTPQNIPISQAID
ncbi:MAG: hypothetical protein K2X01_02480 [Cyanobacteria bacterium]|nr:hypothetical protein [Cyanobacteriota bacterium]